MAPLRRAVFALHLCVWRSVGFPATPFPATFHTWMVTSVLEGDSSDPTGKITYNYGQLVTYKDQDGEQWSCRSGQKNLLQPMSQVPGDFCSYSGGGGVHVHRNDTDGALRGVCSSSTLQGGLPALAFPDGWKSNFKFVGAEPVAQKQCNHWSWKDVAPDTDLDFWASIDNDMPCQIVQHRRNLDGDKFDITTWVFHGFSRTIPADSESECKALTCSRSKAKTCCVKSSATDEQLQNALTWACSSSGLDCAPINPGGAHYEPNTVRDHCAWAFEAYWLQFAHKGGTCDFGNTAELAMTCPALLRAAGLFSAFDRDLACSGPGPTSATQVATPVRAWASALV